VFPKILAIKRYDLPQPVVLGNTIPYFSISATYFGPNGSPSGSYSKICEEERY
jgi:hypothetical protein